MTAREEQMNAYKQLAVIKIVEVLVVVAYLGFVTMAAEGQMEIIGCYAPFFLIFVIAILEFFVVPMIQRKNNIKKKQHKETN